MRKDPHGNPLPPRIYYKSGRYYYVRGNRWHTLSKDYTTALIQRARLESPSGDWAALVQLVYERYHKRHLDGDLATATLKQAEAIGLDPQALAGHSSRAMTERYLRLKKTAIVRGPVKLGGNG